MLPRLLPGLLLRPLLRPHPAWLLTLRRLLTVASLSRLMRPATQVRLALMSVVGAAMVVARVAKVVLLRVRGHRLLMVGPSA